MKRHLTREVPIPSWLLYVIAGAFVMDALAERNWGLLIAWIVGGLIFSVVYVVELCQDRKAHDQR